MSDISIVERRSSRPWCSWQHSVSARGLLAQTPWVAPDAEKAKKNPLPADKKIIEQGEKIAKVNCVTCHGAKGKGDGAAAVGAQSEAGGLDLERACRDETDGELFWKISNGRGAMPPWKHLPENDRWAVIRYIRSLKK